MPITLKAMSCVTQFTFVDTKHPDMPVDIILEPKGNRDNNFQGQVTLRCDGDVWTKYWAAMANPLYEFFLGCDIGYLVSKLGNWIDKTLDETDPAELEVQFKRRILYHRRTDPERVTREQAREWWDAVEEDSLGEEETHDLWFTISDGDGPGFPQVENPKWHHLAWVIETARTGIREYQAAIDTARVTLPFALQRPDVPPREET